MYNNSSLFTHNTHINRMESTVYYENNGILTVITYRSATELKTLVCGCCQEDNPF